MLQYLTAPIGCVQRISATLKAASSQAKYDFFMQKLRSTVLVMQSTLLEKVFFIIVIQMRSNLSVYRNTDALKLWNERCMTQ